MFLKDHLECVFVRHRAGDRQPGVLDALRLLCLTSSLGEPQVLGTGHEMALKDRVRRGGGDRGLEQVGIGVTEAVDADSADEIQQRRAVGQTHPRAAPGSPGDHRKQQRTTAQSTELAEGLLHRGRGKGAFASLLGDRIDQGAGGFTNPGRLVQGRERIGFCARHGTCCIGAPSGGLLLKFSNSSDDALLSVPPARERCNSTAVFSPQLSTRPRGLSAETTVN